jgi:hypothetical protein
MEFKEQFKGQPTHMTAAMGGLYVDPNDIMECESDGVRREILLLMRCVSNIDDANYPHL